MHLIYFLLKSCVEETETADGKGTKKIRMEGKQRIHVLTFLLPLDGSLRRSGVHPGETPRVTRCTRSDLGVTLGNSLGRAPWAL